MDIYFEKNGVLFVWNSKKANTNRHKHGISFERATEAFFDPFLRLVDARRNDEFREAVIGYDENDRLLFVVHVEIESESIRLISARKATLEEQENYDS